MIDFEGVTADNASVAVLDEAEGLHPDALKVLADYLLGEVISIVCERRPDGRLAARVHFLRRRRSRVVEIRDAHNVLIEKNPLPWHLQEAVSARPGRPGKRSRMSGLAARVS